MRKIVIRNEEEKDYEKVEALTRKAFYNVYIPGCTEHYLVHIMRDHEDFIKELDFVMEIDGQIIGSIMYTKAKLIDEKGNQKDILTFGPLCIDPQYQRQGYGKQLIEYSFQKAIDMGYDVVVIFGNPGNYVGRGFKSCQRYHVCLKGDIFPTAMLVKELKEGALDGRKYYYYDSPVMQIDEEEAFKYDESLEEKLERKVLPCQEEFYILSHSTMSD